MRHHSGTVSGRYLAPPAATVGCLLGLLLALVWPPTLILPAGYLLAVLAGTVATWSRLSWRARLALPVVYATMHLAWGWGFLTSPRSLGRGSGGTSRVQDRFGTVHADEGIHDILSARRWSVPIHPVAPRRFVGGAHRGVWEVRRHMASARGRRAPGRYVQAGNQS